jgi:hypothetical protein
LELEKLPKDPVFAVGFTSCAKKYNGAVMLVVVVVGGGYDRVGHAIGKSFALYLPHHFISYFFVGW